MAKKFVRGITDVKTITNQDFDTNNVNDLLSDGQYNYIHRKKGKNEEYHNLTDNIKTLSSDNTELLSVTNYNKTTNTATLHPKHDKQKEQLLESTRDTITINHGVNGTDEKTTVDTNPQKVLEHENLHTTYGISKSTAGNITTLGIEYTKVEANFDLNNLVNGKVKGNDFINSPKESTWFFVSAYSEGSYCIQRAVALDRLVNKTWIRHKREGVWYEWKEQVGDKSTIDTLLSQKQNVLTAGTGITIQGNTISASAPTLTIYEFPPAESVWYFATKYVMEYERYVLTTYVFDCESETAEGVLNPDLKEDIDEFIPTYKTITSGALSITRDGADIKLLNSAPSRDVIQHATFTFVNIKPNGGGGGGGTIK